MLKELRERVPGGFDEPMIQAVLDASAPALDSSAIAALMGNTPESQEAAAQLVSWVSQVAGVIGGRPGV